MNRKLKSKLPINEKLLDTSIPINPITDMERYQNTQKHKFDKTINRKVKKYSENDKVLWLKNNQWEKGIIIGICDTPRSYLIKSTKNGKIFRRTSKHLKNDNTVPS